MCTGMPCRDNDWFQLASQEDETTVKRIDPTWPNSFFGVGAVAQETHEDLGELMKADSGDQVEE